MTKSSKRLPSHQDPAAVAVALLDGEQVSFEVEEAPAEATDEELNSRYAKGEIRIVTEQARYPLAGILQMLADTLVDESGRKVLRYKLDPEYQRRHRWSVVRKSRLIESFLLNVPVPPVFLYERDYACYEVMDGRQRLTALSEFYADGFALEGLEHWPDLDGRTYSQLPSRVRDGINRRYISSIILLRETADNEAQATVLKKLVFARLNSGGVKLGSQETRNAVYGGPLNRLCIELSGNELFRRMWGIPLNPDDGDASRDDEAEEPTDDGTALGVRMFEKMEDVELVLRFFAYRQIREFKAGLNKISEFLDRFIEQGNEFPESVFADYRAMFENTISFLWEALGGDAFTVLSSARRRATKIVYDPLMFAANSPDVIPHRDLLLAHKDVLKAALLEMYQANTDLFSGRRTNFADSQQRNVKVQAAFVLTIAKLLHS